MTKKKGDDGKKERRKKGASWSEEDLKFFEKRLMEEREKAVMGLGQYGRNLSNTQRDSSGDLSSYAFHMADLGTDAMEREKAFLFASQEGRLLYHIDEALRRLYKGDRYGLCEYCNNKIDRRRLTIIPHARLCIACKEKEEKSNR